MSKQMMCVFTLALSLGVGFGCSGKQNKDEVDPTDAGAKEGSGASDAEGKSGSTAESKMKANEALLAKAYNEEFRQAELAIIQAESASFMEVRPEAYTDETRAAIASCEGDACIEGRVIEFGPEPLVFEELIAAMPFWFKGCETGSSAACLMLGKTYLMTALSIDEDPRTRVFGERDSKELDKLHVVLAQRACALDTTRSVCGYWADHYIGEDVREEAWLAYASAHLDLTCDEGDRDACRSLAYHITEKNLDRELSEARALNKKSCELHDNKTNGTCQLYAAMLANGVGGEVDKEGAMVYFEAACAPESDYWKESCEGDPAAGEEVCGLPIAMDGIAACLAVGGALMEKEGASSPAAARIHAAMCRRNFFDENQLPLLGACEAAIAAYTEQGDTQAVKGVAARYCGKLGSYCMMNGEDSPTCKMSRDECEAKYGLTE